ncbi:tetratricopeptide repeat protein [Paraburkholderia sp.]|uniref:tetratricopeptide repeat protein n=1 Tax=Paraburkholderia sp. TaxID=1926495 RepID=UPI00286F010C|nr:tetratricopeptide repeat protein [Paraburkholderia sp.]
MNRDLEHALDAAQHHAAAGQVDEAVRLLQDVLNQAPDHGEALEGLGYLAARQGDHARAADYLVRASANMAMSTEQLHFAAQVCQLAQRHADALALYERALERSPHHAESVLGVAMALIRLEQPQRALATMEQLCKLQPRSPEAHYNRGTLLGTMTRYDEELDAYRHAIALNPRFVLAHVNLGVALRDLGRFDEAMQQFKKALSIDPNDAGARTNRAQTNLLRGEFEHGWREYEWRWRDGSQDHGFPAQTLWSGAQPIAGKTLFVHHEQGYGDTLQFVRFVDRLSAAGARVVLRVQDALLPLLRGYRGAAEVIGEQDAVPPFDYHVPLLSLPFVLKLRAADLAVATPYLDVDGDATRAAQWDDVLASGDGNSDNTPRIGIVWSGSRTHLNDRNRSMTLEQLLPLFRVDARFFALQPDIREGDRDALAQLEQRGVLHDVSARLTNFADTAAFVARLDLVISVDTAVAHLAGALGKPVWVALPFMPDWRWQLGRSDTPWYANARLFRQARRDDWSNVIGELRAALDAWPRA